MTVDQRNRVTSSDPMTTDDVAHFARQIRELTLVTINRAGLGHIGGDYSVTDILATLYGRVLRVDPANPSWADRDRFILSKGHAAVSLYSTLALSGFFPVAWLDTFAGPLSVLNGHPNCTRFRAWKQTPVRWATASRLPWVAHWALNYRAVLVAPTLWSAMVNSKKAATGKPSCTAATES